MIYGIASAPGPFIAGGPLGAIGSPYLSAHWTAAAYSLLGASTTHEALFLDDDAYWFLGGSAQVLIDGDGAHYDPAGPATQGFSLRGAGKATFLGVGAPRVFLFEFLVSSTETFSRFSFIVSDPTFDNDFTLDINYGPQIRAFDDEGDGFLDTEDYGVMDSPTRIALRIDATDFTMCVNGSAPVTTASLGSPHPLSDTASVPVFVWGGEDTAYLRKFEVYGDLSDADLQSLSWILPDGAVADFNFAAGVYYANGATRSIAYLIDDPSIGWGTYDPSYLVPGVGYAWTETYGTGFSIQNVIAGPLIAAGVTVLCVVQQLDAANSQFGFDLVDLPTNSIDFGVYLNGSAGLGSFLFSPDDFIATLVVGPGGSDYHTGLGVYRLVVSFAPDGTLSACVNGNPVLDIPASDPTGLTVFGINFKNNILSQLTAYPLMSSPDMVTLSTP